MNYYRRYMGDYAKKTASLSLAEHGAYNLLLDECYSTELPLPGDHESLFRLCRAMNRVEQDAVRRVADRFFPVGADGLRRNPRADEELAIAQPAISAARTNGVKGGRPKKNPVGFDDEPTGGHPPTPILQPPSPSPQPSTATQGQNPSAARRAPARVNGKAKYEARTNPCWQAYSDAYAQLYGVEPVRNAKVNGMLAKFLDRVPVAEAPQIAAFYVHSKRGLYVAAKHAIDLLLRDAEALRTEWATGHAGTDTEARQADRTAATGNAFAPLIAEARARELTEKANAK